MIENQKEAIMSNADEEIEEEKEENGISINIKEGFSRLSKVCSEITQGNTDFIFPASVDCERDVVDKLTEALGDLTPNDKVDKIEGEAWAKANFIHIYQTLVESKHLLAGCYDTCISIGRLGDYQKKKMNIPQIRHYIDRLQDLVPMLNTRAVMLLKPAIALDVSPSQPGNGYRSMISVLGSALTHLNGRLSLFLHQSRRKINLFFDYFEFGSYLNDYVHILDMIGKILQLAFKIVSEVGPTTVFYDEGFNDAKVLARSMPIQHFYGQRFGFQYPACLCTVFETILTTMALYSEGYEVNDARFKISFNSLSSSVSVATDPKKRAEVLVSKFNNLDIGFNRSFWNLSETTLAKHAGKLLAPLMAINRMINIPVHPLTVPIDRNQVKSMFAQSEGFSHVPVRLISYQWLHGQIYQQDHINTYPQFMVTNQYAFKAPASNSMILHFHGGGFVAQSSLSHEVYLRQWAKALDCPIVSVDYSLSPEYPYPRALNECYYIYCWLLANHDMVGCNRGRIILAGDSAGGNLCVAVALKAANEGVPQPLSLMPIYPALNLRSVASPARLLSMMDPLIPFEILLSCLNAYVSNNKHVDDDGFLSPCLAPDDLLKKLCPIYLGCAELDPLLDDSVMFAKRIKSLNINMHFKIFKSMPHGFLGFTGSNVLCTQAAEYLLEWLKIIVKN